MLLSRETSSFTYIYIQSELRECREKKWLSKMLSPLNTQRAWTIYFQHHDSNLSQKKHTQIFKIDDTPCHAFIFWIKIQLSIVPFYFVFNYLTLDVFHFFSKYAAFFDRFIFCVGLLLLVFWNHNVQWTLFFLCLFPCFLGLLFELSLFPVQVSFA